MGACGLGLVFWEFRTVWGVERRVQLLCLLLCGLEGPQDSRIQAKSETGCAEILVRMCMAIPKGPST